MGRPTTRAFRCSAASLILGMGLALTFALLVASHFASRYLMALEPVLLLYLAHRPELWRSVVEEQELARLRHARRVWAVFRAAEYSRAGLKQLEGMRGEPGLVLEARHRIQLRLYE